MPLPPLLDSYVRTRDARRQTTDSTTVKAFLMNINRSVLTLPGNLPGAYVYIT